MAKPITAADLDEMKQALCYDPDSGVFTWKIGPRWQMAHVAIGKVAGRRCNTTGYWDISFKGKRYKAHRIAWQFTHRPITDMTLCIDHINGIRTDNRIENLRLVTESINGINKEITSKHTPSGHVGIYWRKVDRVWSAKIVHNKKQVHIGSFRSMEDAIVARDAWRTVHDPLGIRW